MRTFRVALRVFWGHKAYLGAYLILLSIMGVFVTFGITSGANATAYEDETPKVAVIDRDGSAISQGITAFAARRGTLVWIDDTERALQDAAAQNLAAYVLVIPSGYGQDLMDAATAGADAPALDTVISYASASGSLMDQQVRQYLQSAYGFASTIASTQDEVVGLTDEAMGKSVEVMSVPVATTPVNARLAAYDAWSTYPLFAAITVLIAVLMKTFNASDLRKRELAAPTQSSSRSFQLFCACLVMGVLSWAWVCAVDLAFFGGEALAESSAQVAIMGLSMLVYAIVSVCCGFLLGQLSVSEQAANAVGNIFGMLFSFLGGAWLDFSLLGDATRAVAHFVPSYWENLAISGAASVTSLSVDKVMPLLGYIGIEALFAVAILAVALAVGRASMQES